jgi:hypothetical protein
MHKLLDNIFGEKKYMDWNEYEKRVNFLDHFHWQQSIRKSGIKNT